MIRMIIVIFTLIMIMKMTTATSQQHTQSTIKMPVQKSDQIDQHYNTQRLRLTHVLTSFCQIGYEFGKWVWTLIFRYSNSNVMISMCRKCLYLLQFTLLFGKASKWDLMDEIWREKKLVWQNITRCPIFLKALIATWHDMGLGLGAPFTLHLESENTCSNISSVPAALFRFA